ncbi:MAG: hypothetical protein NTW11_04130 [Candidatus Staskawiczbacteria bacterium]|nr:hypothetical protein [Candidatus Staskawiczbacteria bacterium]
MNIKNFFKITGVKIITAIILIVISFTSDYFYVIGPTTSRTTDTINWSLSPLPMLLNTIVYGPGSGPEFPNLVTLVGLILQLVWYYFLACIIVLIINKIKK